MTETSKYLPVLADWRVTVMRLQRLITATSSETDIDDLNHNTMNVAM